MKLTYIYGSAVHLRNDRRREILKIPDAVGAKAGRYTGKLGIVSAVYKLFGGSHVEARLKHRNCS